MTPGSLDTLRFGTPRLEEIGDLHTRFTWPDGFYLIEYLNPAAIFDHTIRDELIERANAKRAALTEAGLIP